MGLRNGTAVHPSADIPLTNLPISPYPESPTLDDNEPPDTDNAHTHLLPSSNSQIGSSKPATTPFGPPTTKASKLSKSLVALSLIFLCVAIVILAKAAALSEQEVAEYCYIPGEKIPEYFQPTKTDFRGPTATGRPPLLVVEDTVLGKSGRAGPLELDLQIEGGDGKEKSGIWRLMGHLSMWYMDENGFGADEYPLPAGVNITQVHVLHRHGARYPTEYSPAVSFGKNLSAIVAQGHSKFKGNLSFLNSWTYALGAEVLVPFGRQQLFTSGVSHYYTYGSLYNTSSRIIARTTTQDRMLESAENFLAGFFGLDWTRNVTLETIIEASGFNNSLAGYDNCPNSYRKDLQYGRDASRKWREIYLQNATKRLQDMSPTSFTWTPQKAYAAQQLCPYEIVAFGYSPFCSLFTWEEWEGFEYAIDLEFTGNDMFQSPTGRAVGIGWVEELLARLDSHLITEPTAQDNITLDNNTVTFPLNQTLYLDFTHDTNIAAVLTALGLKQFSPTLPAEGPPNPDRAVKVSHLTPFAARLAIEVISAPKPVKASREGEGEQYDDGEETKYVHFLLNGRTIPLGKSWDECGERQDGWCELGTFFEVQKGSLEKARWEEVCFGGVKAGKYGDVGNGVSVP